MYFQNNKFVTVIAISELAIEKSSDNRSFLEKKKSTIEATYDLENGYISEKEALEHAVKRVKISLTSDQETPFVLERFDSKPQSSSSSESEEKKETKQTKEKTTKKSKKLDLDEGEFS